MPFSSQRSGMWARTSSGWMSWAMTTSLAWPRSMSFVTSFVPFLTAPVSRAASTASYALSWSSLGASNRTNMGMSSPSMRGATTVEVGARSVPALRVRDAGESRRAAPRHRQRLSRPREDPYITSGGVGRAPRISSARIGGAGVPALDAVRELFLREAHLGEPAARRRQVDAHVGRDPPDGDAGDEVAFRGELLAQELRSLGRAAAGEGELPHVDRALPGDVPEHAQGRSVELLVHLFQNPPARRPWRPEERARGCNP